MITGEIKNKIDKIWTDIWAGGITNPLTIIEQLTYLMFIHSLDEKELETESMERDCGEKLPKIFPETPAGQAMRWSSFSTLGSPEEVFNLMSMRVFPAIKAMKNGRLPDFNSRGQMVWPDPEVYGSAAGGEFSVNSAFTQHMEKAVFVIPTPLVLDKIISGLNDLYKTELHKGLDLQGDLYEYMLSKLSSAGQNGQFRTPKHIREMMVELLKPTPEDSVCDPSCGTAGFLISSADRISAMNLMLHSISNPEIAYLDSLSKNNEICDKYTICLANPPFKGTVDAESINDNLKAVTNTKKTELLFIALFLRILKKGGQCACIVPDGVLFGSSKAHQSIRRELVENHQLRAVISMPSGVFKPYAGVSTAVLVFTKTDAGGTDKVWFFDMKADGYSLDDKRSEISENDIPEIIRRFHDLDNEEGRARTEQSFLVPKQEIVDNGYDLSINKYKKTEYQPVQYPPTQEILKNIRDLESEIQQSFAELEKLLQS